ncbi:MAG: hypothetical protein MK193_02450 [Lentisphaeria bacterium]|nr:hypothetical protein [Lentisphaeria bacterium]
MHLISQTTLAIIGFHKETQQGNLDFARYLLKQVKSNEKEIQEARDYLDETKHNT